MPEQQQFLFVNTGNPSKGEHKISTTGRAFVIRKARATHTWSTKGKTKRRGNRSASGSGSTTGAARQDDPGKRGQAIEKGPAADHTFTQIKEMDSRNMLHSLPGSGGCSICLRSRGECVCTIWSTSTAVVPVPTSRFSNVIDPFRAMSLDLDDGDTRLLAYYHVANNCLAPRITLLDSGGQSLEAHQYWKKMSLEHPGFMHGVLCIAAVKLALVQSRPAPDLVERFMYHRIQAMAAIQRNLADSQLALSDENLASVFNLVCIEETLALEAPLGLANDPAWALLEPDEAQREAHVVGWRRMLALRGGVRGLSPAFQCFVIRWGYSALSNLLIGLYGQPHLYRSAELAQLPDCNTPTGSETRVAGKKADFAVSRFLPAFRSLPQNVLGRFYRYPQTSPFGGMPSPMAEACGRVQMHPGLVSHIFTVHCMIRDGIAWLEGSHQYSWDHFNIQNMFATATGELVRWIYENETILSAPEKVTALTLFAFLLFSCDGQHSVCGPLPGIMPRLREHIQEATVMPMLQAAGIDTWVALVLLIATKDSCSMYKDVFLQYFIDTVDIRSPPVRTFEELLATLDDCLWTPAMNVHARKVWNKAKTQTEWDRLRMAFGSGPLGAVSWSCGGIQHVTAAEDPTLPSFFPTSDGFTKVHRSFTSL